MSVKLTAGQPIKSQIYLAWHSAAACNAGRSSNCCRFPHFIFSSVVRDLGVTLGEELTFASHNHRHCQLHQLRTEWTAAANVMQIDILGNL